MDKKSNHEISAFEAEIEPNCILKNVHLFPFPVSLS